MLFKNLRITLKIKIHKNNEKIKYNLIIIYTVIVYKKIYIIKSQKEIKKK